MKIEIYYSAVKSATVSASTLLDLAKSKDVQFVPVNIVDDHDSIKFLMDQGLRTLPQLFADGKHIGGYEEALAFLEKLEDKPINEEGPMIA